MNGGTRSYELAKSLIENGHSVTVVTSIKVNQIYKPKEVDGILIKWLSVPYDNRYGFTKRIIAFVKFVILSSYYTLFSKYDLIYCTSTPLTIGLPALIAKIVRGKKFIFEVRDVWPEIPIAMGVIRNHTIITLLKKFANIIYKYSSHIITLSVDMKREILKYNVPEEKITVIENGSRSENFKYQEIKRKSFIKSHNINPSAKILIYPGAFGYVNDLSYLVNLASKFSQSELIFILIGEGIDKDRIISLAKENNLLNKNLFILNGVAKKEIYELISISDFLISTVADIEELSMNSANKFFDGLRAGKCVLVNHGGWQEEFLRRSKSGISLSRDLQTASITLRKIINTESYKEMGRNALENSDCFEFVNLSNKLLNVINAHGK